MDSDSNAEGHDNNNTNNKRKRSRAENNDRDRPTPTGACDQCRLRKVRCDRLQPECSNCRKAGVECNSSNGFKRVNHTKQLRDDFSIVLNQLIHVDQALGNLTDLTRQIAQAQSQPHVCLQPSHESPPSSSLDRLDSISSGSSATPDPAAGNESLLESAELDRGGVPLYSYPAPLVLVKSLLRQISGAITTSDEQEEGQENEKMQSCRVLQHPATRATLRQKLQDFPFKSLCPDPVAPSDTTPVTVPPQLLVNLFVPGFLHNVNKRWPIFEEDLCSAANAHYSADQPRQDKAWALSMNNIVLLELGLELQAARASHSNSFGMNNDILPSFLRNCDRAMANLDAYMTPSLANLQALLTLTLAARQFYNNATAEKVCHAACRVGRALGLHRSNARHSSERSKASLESEKERERLFRVLYMMDKQRVLMTGQLCDLYICDSDHQIGSDRNRGDAPPSASDAYDDLMILWEEIYTSLYSPRAAVAGVETRVRQMHRVTKSMEIFAQKHAKLLDLPAGQESADHDRLLIELAYGYHVLQILVLRCARADEQSQSKLLKLARSSLQLILDTGKSSPLSVERLALLTTIFRNYPMVAFVELVAFRLTSFLKSGGQRDSATQADISLLRAIRDQLDVLKFDDNFSSYSFYARLQLGLSWALDTLEALSDALSRSALQDLPTAARQGSNCRGEGVSPRSSASVSSNPNNKNDRASPMSSANPTVPDIISACNLGGKFFHQVPGSGSSTANLVGVGATAPFVSEDNASQQVQNGLLELVKFGLFTQPQTTNGSTPDIAVSQPLLSTACQSRGGQPSSSASSFPATAAVAPQAQDMDGFFTSGRSSSSDNNSGSNHFYTEWGDTNIDLFHGGSLLEHRWDMA